MSGWWVPLQNTRALGFYLTSSWQLFFKMDVIDMLFDLRGRCRRVVTCWTFMWFDLVVNTFYMGPETSKVLCFIIAQHALDIPYILVHCFNVPFKVTHPVCLVVAFWTLLVFDALMSALFMIFQTTLICRCIWTDVAAEWLTLFMNCFDVTF